MARSDVRRRRPNFRIAALAAGAVACGAVALAAAPQTTQPAPAQRGLPKDAPAPDKKLEVKKCAVLGADPTGALFLASVGKDGHREEFGPIAADTAFEIWLDRIAPTKVSTKEPDPDHPGETRVVEHLKVPVSPVSIAEVDAYLEYVRAMSPVGNEGMFVNTLLGSLLEQRAFVLYYYDVLPAMKERLQRAADKIDKGIPFEKVIRQNSEDDQGKMNGGWFGNNVRGENLSRYPFEQVVFGLEPGDVVGPVFDKFMAYIMLCDRHPKVDDKHHGEQVLTRVVASRYAVNLLSSKDGAQLMTAIRVRSDKERFLRVLPPGAQVPPAKAFGPDDVAPIGKPETPLKFRSSDEKVDGKSRADH